MRCGQRPHHLLVLSVKSIHIVHLRVDNLWRLRLLHALINNWESLSQLWLHGHVFHIYLFLIIMNTPRVFLILSIGFQARGKSILRSQIIGFKWSARKMDRALIFDIFFNNFFIAHFFLKNYFFFVECI